MYTKYMQTSEIKVENMAHSSHLDFNYKLFFGYILTIVKSFGTCHSWDFIVQIKINLVITFHGPNKAENQK